MWWGSAKQCQCNGSAATQECAPILTAAVKSTCGARRLLVSAVILIFLLAAIYWISLPNQRSTNPARRPMRIQQPPQSSRNSASERTEAAEATE